MARKVLILAGAPETNVLNWDEPSLLNDFTTPFTTFVSLTDEKTYPETESDTAVWRSIPLHRVHVPTGFSQSHALHEWYQGNNDFASSLNPSFGDATSHASQAGDFPASQDTLSQFYDHSVAIHDDISSSQIEADSISSTDLSSFMSADESSVGNITTSGQQVSPPASGAARLGTGHLSDLEDIPKASYLESILPQTVTVNLIVAIISIAQPRTVKTRWGSDKWLVELLVGDDTKSGFSVTFWLSSNGDPGTGNAADEVLKSLRRQDVVLLRNVALGVFMKKVHGHSLRRGLTKVHLLHRRKLSVEDARGFYSTKDISSRKGTHPQLVKARKVHEWAIDFVSGGTVTALGKRRQAGRAVRSWEQPPEDTQ